MPADLVFVRREGCCLWNDLSSVVRRSVCHGPVIRYVRKICSAMSPLKDGPEGRVIPVRGGSENRTDIAQK